MTINASLDKRLNRVVRNHERMRRNGVVHKVGRDGLIRSRPRLIRPRFPLRGVLLMVGLLLAFKAVMLAQLGATNYGQKVQDLRNGTMVQQAGAFLMQEEAITIMLSGYLTRYVFVR